MRKQISEWAQAAKAIRKELKLVFPAIKFSVESQSYSMGNSVWVYWNNGPEIKDINNIVKKYQYGHYDGMTDCYEHSNKRKDIPQAMFVNCQSRAS